MPMDSVNEENVENLKHEYEKVQKDLEELKNKSIISMYCYEELEETRRNASIQGFYLVLNI